MRYEKARLSGDVHIDGNEFIDCTFENGTILHFGGADYVISGTNTFGHWQLMFHGNASNTLGFLRFLYKSVPNGLELIKALLEAQPDPPNYSS